MPERVDERRGDVVWDCGQALGAGDVRGVDEALQGLGDLDRPVRVGVGLGSVSKITKQVSCA